MIATNISSVTKVPMFAGRKLFIATPTAYAVTIGQNRPRRDRRRCRMP